jgi:hypothetical protein
MDLKPKVSGKGNLTVKYQRSSATTGAYRIGVARTQDEPFEKKVDPSHHDHLRHHHHHLRPHARHHPVHGRGIGEWIGWCRRFALLRWTVLEVRTLGKCLR